MIIARENLALAGVWVSDDVVPSLLRVDLASDTYATTLKVVVPVAAGDLLDINAWARLTNDLGYTVGVGYHLWVYNVDDGVPYADKTWIRVSPLKGDNVDKVRHHLPVDVSSVWQVPADWPEGHRLVVILRTDAHSTAWQPNHYLKVDQGYGQITVRRWVPAPVPQPPAPCECPPLPPPSGTCLAVIG